MCHDSVSCKNWRPNVEPYPVLREENEYVGQPYDEDDVPSEVINFFVLPVTGGLIQFHRRLPNWRFLQVLEELAPQV